MARRGVRLKPGFREFYNGYADTALWASSDESDDSGGRPLDDNYNSTDFSRAAVKKMKKDCASFMHHNKSALERFVDEGHDLSDAGHNFWLSRNGHGTGFWDGYGEVGDDLHRSAKEYGEQYLYVGDDGKIHVQ